uniref:Putative secreted protein n=1 Tax=Anopheles darlingi TaxID=43151 RepID=A0A2M4DA65_ANODA
MFLSLSISLCIPTLASVGSLEYLVLPFFSPAKKGKKLEKRAQVPWQHACMAVNASSVPLTGRHHKIKTQHKQTRTTNRNAIPGAAERMRRGATNSTNSIERRMGNVSWARCFKNKTQIFPAAYCATSTSTTIRKAPDPGRCFIELFDDDAAAPSPKTTLVVSYLTRRMFSFRIMFSRGAVFTR